MSRSLLFFKKKPPICHIHAYVSTKRYQNSQNDPPFSQLNDNFRQVECFLRSRWLYKQPPLLHSPYFFNPHLNLKLRKARSHISCCARSFSLKSENDKRDELRSFLPSENAFNHPCALLPLHQELDTSSGVSASPSAQRRQSKLTTNFVMLLKQHPLITMRLCQNNNNASSWPSRCMKPQYSGLVTSLLLPIPTVAGCQISYDASSCCARSFSLKSNDDINDELPSFFHSKRD